MNYYHLSYDLIDVETGDNDAALESIVNLVAQKFGGEVLNRPVRSTIIFSGVLDFETIRKEIYAWSNAVSAYYVVSEIRSTSAEGAHCRMVANKKLEDGLSSKKQA